MSLFAAFGQLILRESGQFECWDGDGKRVGGHDGNVGVLCV